MVVSRVREFLESVQRGILGLLLAPLFVMSIGVVLNAFEKGQILYGAGGIVATAVTGLVLALLFYEGYSNG